MTLTCKIIQGQPQPQITWLKIKLSEGHNMSLSCEAKSPGGISAENIYISVKGKFLSLKLDFKSFSCVSCGRIDSGLIAVG